MTLTSEWMQTEFIQAEGKDGKSHSFWVHRMWEITGTRLKAVDQFKARWYQYTLRPNQEETRLIESP